MATKVQITPIVTGYFWLPFGPFFGVAEPVVRKKYSEILTIDARDRVFLYVRGLLVRTPHGIFIVEPGLGTKKHEYAEKYNLPTRFSWEHILRSFELSPKDITGVFSSHLHWDHAGGNTGLRGDADKVVPEFPNATYFLHEKELEHARNAQAHRLPQSYDIRDIPPENQITKVTQILTEAVPRIWIELTGGHTQGHCIIHIEDDQKRHVFMGDIAPTHIHLTQKGGYEMAFDDEAGIILERKRSVIKRAKDENWRLYFVHDPFFASIDSQHIPD